MTVGSLAEPVSNPRLGPHSLHYLVTRVRRQYQLRQRTVATISFKECVYFFCQARVIRVIMGVKRKLDIIDITEKKRLQWYGHVKRMPNERISKLIMDWIPRERRKKRTSKKNMDGRSTSSHDNKKFRTRSMGKHRAMVFGFWKKATAVKNMGYIQE
jgi:hypothetical protein